MNTGQTMLTIFAMVLLSAVILTVNRGFLTTNVTMAENRVDILAVSLGNSIIEDATSMAFDEQTVGAAVSSPTSLTSSTLLGLDSGESSSNPSSFDDFDDYNSYKTNPKVDTIGVPGTTNKYTFKTYCKVDYVDPNNPDNITANKTYHKKIQLKIFSPGMSDTVRMSTVYSYWYFR